MASKAPVPSYEPMLGAYHRAFAVELRAMIAALPISEGQALLDMACGDGVYSPLLAERVGAAGSGRGGRRESGIPGTGPAGSGQITCREQHRVQGCPD